MKIYGIYNGDAAISVNTFYTEYEYNIEQLFSSVSLGLKTCKTTMLTTDLIWLEDLMQMIAQWKDRSINEGKNPTNEEIWEEFNLSCIRERFLCKYDIDILQLGRENDLLSEEIICDKNDTWGDGPGEDGSRGDDGNLCRNTRPSYTVIGERQLEVTLNDVFDIRGIIINSTTPGVTVNTEVHGDRAIVTLDGGDEANLSISFNGCNYTVEANGRGCDHNVFSHYDADTDTFIIDISSSAGSTEIEPKFFSEGFEVRPDKYEYDEDNNQVRIPNASQFAGSNGLWISYACGIYSFSIPEKSCNTEILGYNRTSNSMEINIVERESGRGSYPPGIGDINITFNNVNVPFTLEDGKIVLNGYGNNVNLQGVFAISVEPCTTYTLPVFPQGDVILPDSYVHAVCGTLSIVNNAITVTQGCDLNTYLISYNYDPATEVVSKIITLLETTANACQSESISTEYRCNNGSYQSRITTNRCCLIGGQNICTPIVGEWTNMDVPDEQNPCIERGDIIIPLPYNQEVCGTLVNNNGNISIIEGCDRNYYTISFYYDDLLNRVEPIITLNNSISNGCRTTVVTTEYRCNEGVYESRTATQTCCRINGQDNCNTSYTNWASLGLDPNVDPCSTKEILPDPYEQEQCGTLSVVNGNIVATSNCDMNRYRISYGPTMSDITVTLLTNTPNGCQTTTNRVEHRCNEGNYQERTVTETCCLINNQTVCNNSATNWQTIQQDPNPCDDPSSVIIPQPYTQTICGTMGLDQNGAIVITDSCNRNTYDVSFDYNEETDTIDTIISLTNSIVNGCRSTIIITEYRCNEGVYERRDTTRTCCLINGQMSCNDAVGQWVDTEVPEEQNPCLGGGQDTKQEVSCKYVCHNNYVTNQCITRSYHKENNVWVEDNNSPITVNTPTQDLCSQIQYSYICSGFNYVQSAVTKTFTLNSVTNTWGWVIVNHVDQIVEANSSRCGGNPCGHIDLLGIAYHDIGGEDSVVAPNFRVNSLNTQFEFQRISKATIRQVECFNPLINDCDQGEPVNIYDYYPLPDGTILTRIQYPFSEAPSLDNSQCYVLCVVLVFYDYYLGHDRECCLCINLF